MELYESIANEHDPQDLRALILRLSVLLDAKELLRETDKIPDKTATTGSR
jgi:hypothetical protein